MFYFQRFITALPISNILEIGIFERMEVECVQGLLFKLVLKRKDKRRSKHKFGWTALGGRRQRLFTNANTFSIASPVGWVIGPKNKFRLFCMRI